MGASGGKNAEACAAGAAGQPPAAAGDEAVLRDFRKGVRSLPQLAQWGAAYGSQEQEEQFHSPRGDSPPVAHVQPSGATTSGGGISGGLGTMGKAGLGRRASFASFGSLERVNVPRQWRRRLTGTTATLRVVEPPTPLRRGATDDVLPAPRGPQEGLFDFDKLDALEEEHSPLQNAENSASNASACSAKTAQGEDSFGRGADAFFDFDTLPGGCMDEMFDWDSLEDAPPVSFSLNRGSSAQFAAQPSSYTPSSCASDYAGVSGAEANPSAKRPRHTRRRASTSAPPAERPNGLRVALVVNGSRGDVQPMLALALRLQQLRHHIRMLTNADLVDFCTDRGVDALPVFASCSDVMESIGGMAGGENGELITESWKKCSQGAQAWLRANPGSCRAVDDCLLEFGPDVVVCGAQATGPCMRLEIGAGVPFIVVSFCVAQLDFGSVFTVLQPSRPSFVAVSSFFRARGHTLVFSRLVSDRRLGAAGASECSRVGRRWPFGAVACLPRSRPAARRCRLGLHDCRGLAQAGHVGLGAVCAEGGRLPWCRSGRLG